MGVMKFEFVDECIGVVDKEVNLVEMSFFLEVFNIKEKLEYSKISLVIIFVQRFDKLGIVFVKSFVEDIIVLFCIDKGILLGFLGEEIFVEILGDFKCKNCNIVVIFYIFYLMECFIVDC